MSKVPVGASIAHAYEFLFGRFFQIIGTAWLPAMLYGLGLYVVLSGVHGAGPIHAAPPAVLAGVVCWGLLFIAFGIVIRSVLNISLTQEAFGIRKDVVFAHLVIGPRELRLFFGYVRYYLLALVLYILVLVLCVAVMWLAEAYGAKLVVSGHPIALPIAGVFCVVLLAAFFLSMLRLFFMLAPVAAAEHRTRLGRAWAISAGSTWRILLVCLGTFLPLWIAAGVGVYYLIGPAAFHDLVHAMQAAKPGDSSPMLEFYGAHAAPFAALSAVSSVLFATLLAGAAATAYRAVTGHEEPEPEDDAALVAPLLAPVEPVAHHEESHAPVEDHGHSDQGHGHEDHGHGGHSDDHGHAPAEDHGHGSDHGHGHGHDAHAGEDGGDDGDDDSHGDDHAHGHDDHGKGHDDHGKGHDDHGHHADHGHDDHGHGHDDHGHGGHGDGHHHAASEAA
jgi:hypothetical protein